MLHAISTLFSNYRKDVSHLMACRYHLPFDIQKHVDFITPGIRLHGGRWRGKDGLRKRAHDSSLAKRSVRDHNTQLRPLPMDAARFLETNKASPLANCDIAITPQCLRGMVTIHEIYNCAKRVSQPCTILPAQGKSTLITPWEFLKTLEIGMIRKT